ncbi:DUF2490 domain-containing protein [Winogradskyella aurantiaca]|uniref:DUF2490 domain-containing protein n=1 Tax=Winogradskyella aurantiaca TaxID=2219558 RepID=UPI000E1C4C6E|nr:DUF2490 domain-containing protein [Winogradskyella aurantiaca]
MNALRTIVLVMALILTYGTSHSQELPEKVINENVQFWISTNNVFRISERWAILNDIHVRRTDFVAKPNFYFIRFGGQYYIKPNIRLAGGYAHLWLTPSGSWDAYQNENRIYQQFSISQKFPKLNAFFRLRTEQRFFNNVVNGQSLNDDFLIHRVRFLISGGIPFKEGSRTELMIANEIHLNFGKNVVYNTFNQNRLTLGIRHKLNDQWKFDCGYMLVYQQLAVGNVYNLNHTIRLFFYGNFDFRKNKATKIDEIRHGEE